VYPDRVLTERTARVRSITRLADQVVAVDVEAIEPPEIRFEPGQFVSVRVSGPEVEAERRSFSLVSNPGRSDGFDLLVKRHGSGATARFADRLAVGDELRYFGPMGYFLFEPAHRGDLVFGATGVGISAIWPMIEAALEGPGDRRVLLFWGLRRRSDVFWKDRLEERARAFERFRPLLCVTAEDGGRITPPIVATAGRLTDPLYYLCGNGDMIVEVKAGLQARGIPRTRFRTEVFHPVAWPA
jgi:ferredoxin-NADP reductase